MPLDTRIQNLPDIRVEHAAGINAFGQIAGWGWDAAAGQSRAFLLTPVVAVPEPAPAALRCAGLLVPAWRRPGKRPA